MWLAKLHPNILPSINLVLNVGIFILVSINLHMHIQAERRVAAHEDTIAAHENKTAARDRSLENYLIEARKDATTNGDLGEVSRFQSMLGNHYSQYMRVEGASVPGNAGLTYCRVDEETTDAANIEYIHLDPYPPVPGENLTIVAEGFLNRAVRQGAMVHLLVKIGWIILVNKPFDLCEESESFLNLTCPIPAGPIKITKEIMIPAAVPPGPIFVSADVVNFDGYPVTCLMGKMNFHSGECLDLMDL